jgi:protein SCO1/2
MRSYFRHPAFAFAALVLSVGGAFAQNVGSYGKAPRPANVDPESFKLPVEQKLGETIPLDTVMYDHSGKPVVLRDLIGGKPTILVPAYYECPKLCNEVLNALVIALREMQQADPKFAAGDAFNVITFSIDAREPPAFASVKRDAYLKNYDGRSPTQPGWWFLSATPGQGSDVPALKRNIRQLTNSFGYPFIVRDQKFTKGPNGEEMYENEHGEAVPVAGSGFVKTGSKERDFLHSSAIVILTPDGRISQYMMGVDYDATTLRRLLVDASGGKIGTLSDKMALLCMNYDQMSGKYKTNMKILSYTAIPFAFLVFGIAGYAVRRSRREAKAAEAATISHGSSEG